MDDGLLYLQTFYFLALSEGNGVVSNVSVSRTPEFGMLYLIFGALASGANGFRAYGVRALGSSI